MLLLHELSRTGAPKVALDIFDALPEIDLRVVATHGGPLETRCRQRASLRVLEPASRRWKHPLPLGARIRIKGQQLSASPFVRGFKPDLIYANSIESLHILRYVRLPNAPILCHVHELESHLKPFAHRLPQLFSSPQKYIAVSNCVSQLLQKLNVPADKIEVVYPFVSEPDEAARFRKTSQKKPFVVGGAGNPIWIKGIDLWLLTAAHMVEILGHDLVRFVWVGVGDNEDSRLFRFKIHKMGLEDVVELVPSTPNPYEHFARFDAFAMTSWEESASLVTLENMLLGTPVICFLGSGGPAEIIGDSGIVVENFSPHDMATKLISLANDSRMAEEISRKGRHRVLENFTAQTQVPRIARIMQQT